jgi:formylglycine-generating enzyme required for sulfatase activity
MRFTYRVVLTSVSLFVFLCGSMGSLRAAPEGDLSVAETDRFAMQSSVPDTLDPYVEQISETLSEFEMTPVPGGTVTVPTADGAKTVEVDAFWIKATEVKWEPYKTFVYGRDQKESGDIDAVSRPTNALPYIAADFGKPREGHPARGMTRKAARNYARWLSQKTGHTYRLPTAAEWVHACRSGLEGMVGASNGALDEYAWHKGNSDGDSHAVAAKAADEIGAYDLLGNLAEWTYTPEESDRHVLRGGTYQTKRSAVTCTARKKEKTQAWKEGDPQLPKSEWWFASGPFVGFRVVRVLDDQ